MSKPDRGGVYPLPAVVRAIPGHSSVVPDNRSSWKGVCGATAWIWAGIRYSRTVGAALAAIPLTLKIHQSGLRLKVHAKLFEDGFLDFDRQGADVVAAGAAAVYQDQGVPVRYLGAAFA